jgi:hypothetical protein
MQHNLPDQAPCSWSGEKLRLKHPVPKIWTQRTGRPFGIYWSDILSFGRLWPAPTDEELNAFYDISSYSEYLSGTRKHTTKDANLIARATMKLAWMNDNGTPDAIPTILSLSAAQPRSV